MNKIILCCALLTSLVPMGFSAERDIKNIPETVLNKVVSDFPDAKMEKAEGKEKDGNLMYKFKLMQGDSRIEACYDKDAKLVTSKQDIAIQDLPAAVKQAVSANYPNDEPKQAWKKMRNNSTVYEVKVKCGIFCRKEVDSDESGKMLGVAGNKNSDCE